ASGPALGSWLAAALVVIFSLPFLLYRAITEDRILQVELAGYSDYAARVQWRLVPGIWLEPNLAWGSMLLTKPGHCHLRGPAFQSAIARYRRARVWDCAARLFALYVRRNRSASNGARWINEAQATGACSCAGQIFAPSG